MSTTSSSQELEQMLGKSLKSLRLQRNLDQISLSERAGVSVSALKQLESGQGATIKTLLRIVRALNRSDWIQTLAPEVSILQKSHSNWLTDIPEITYKRLPSLLADALPDDFGNALIDRYLATLGVQKSKVTALDRLAYMGKRSIGALEFKPTRGPRTEKSKGCICKSSRPKKRSGSSH